jgi:hypothetical protein
MQPGSFTMAMPNSLPAIDNQKKRLAPLFEE